MSKLKKISPSTPLLEAMILHHEEPYEIPKDWKWVKVGYLGEVVGGGTPKSGIEDYYGGEISWITPSDLSRHKSIYIEKGKKSITKLGLSKSSAKLLPKNSVLFSSRAPIGYVVISARELTTSQGFKSFKPSDKYIPKFLYYYLTSAKGLAESMASGTTFLEISATKITHLPIPLPPLSEQERIVARLDQLLGEAANYRQLLAQLPKKIEQFRQSVLARAISGELSATWRAAQEVEENAADLLEEVGLGMKKNTKYDLSKLPELPENWLWTHFGNIAKVSSNLVAPSDYLTYRLVAPNHIEKETGRLLYTESVKESGVKSPKHLFRPGQIIYSKIRPYLSKLTIADFEGLCSADMYPIDTVIYTEYLYYYMLSSKFVAYASNAGSRSVLPKINKKELSLIPIPLPPLAEQKEIVAQVEALLAQADALSDYYERAMAGAEQLPQTILAKAFRGEL